VIILTPLLMALFYAIHVHYRELAKQLSLENLKGVTKPFRNRVIMPISGVHCGTLVALRYARHLSDDITVIHVSIDQEETEKIQSKWAVWGEGVRLMVLHSPYRLFIEPLLNYIDQIDELRQPGETITIVVPQFVPKHWWTNALHMRTANNLRKALLERENIVITEVPYQVK
jgi:hypothetical protein